MHTLRTKSALIKYIGAYKVPILLVDKAHPAIKFSIEKEKYQWSEFYLRGLSTSKLDELAEYLEEVEGISN